MSSTTDDQIRFGKTMRSHLELVEETNAGVLDDVAERLLQVVDQAGLIYTAGAGHSVALVLETFYRAGGLACVYPVTHLGLLPLVGGTESTVLERVNGLASAILSRIRPSPNDVSVIFSNSGVNPFPVELARAFRKAGTPVVAVVSRPHMSAVPARAGDKLEDLADHLIDTRVPLGDVAYQSPGGQTAALSSLTSVYCWNLLLSRLADLAAQAGTDLPLWTSANVPGGDERNAALAGRYRQRIPQL